jgi:hypothetical protein
MMMDFQKLFCIAFECRLNIYLDMHILAALQDIASFAA